MRSWKDYLLSVYYHGTRPYRAWRRARRNAAGMAPILVLFYHRIADDNASPWTLSNGLFAEQMRWLKARFDMVSLAEAQARIAGRCNRRPAVSITFDDGYAANCHTAIPLLLAERIPCTYFVSSQCVLQGIPFPHDVRGRYEGRPNTLEEIRNLAEAGIEIGAHTRTHCDLGRIHNPRKLHEEVVLAGEDLQQAIGRPVRYFAFPFGMPANLNADAFHMAHEYGYDGVCSAYGGYNFPGDDPFHLQRIYAEDLLRLKNWSSVDPRKLIRPYRYEYHAASRPAAEGAVCP